MARLESLEADALLQLTRRTHQSTTASKLLLGRCLHAIDQTDAAAEAGDIDWCKLREIVRRASPETEERWLDLAERYTYAIIQRLVSQTRSAELPDEPTPDRAPVGSELRVTLSRETMDLLRRANRELCSRAERRLATEELFQSYALAVLTGSPFPDEEVRARTMDSIPRNLSAQDDRPMWVEPPWATVAATKELGPGSSS